MIFGNDREIVIENIRSSAETGNFHAKVETGDPVLTLEQERTITARYLSRLDSIEYKVKSAAARKIADKAAKLINKTTEIVGIEKLDGLAGGAVITSNHFSPTENTVIRTMTKKLGKKLNIVSQVSNFAMTGPVGFLMNYADVIPISKSIHYQRGPFMDRLSDVFEKGEYVLIYPEAEMWFNYRKPRPSLGGAYYYAAALDVPVISCFVEIRDLPELDTETFYKVKYVLHILDVIVPPSEGTLKEKYTAMQEKDDALKREAYERIYQKPLNYTFEPSDIAGLVHYPLNEKN